jgi:hypothetical protein
MNDDYAGLLSVAEAGLTDTLEKIRLTRKAVRDGARTREEGFREISLQKKRAEEIDGFLEKLPAPPHFLRVQALYSQAANLTLQAVEGALELLESTGMREEDQAILLRVEAGKQIAEAAKRLKALTAKKPAS